MSACELEYQESSGSSAAEGAQAICVSKFKGFRDLYGNILRFIFKSKYWVECSYIDQNKRKLTSSVVILSS